jgi:hypothetical protein
VEVRISSMMFKTAAVVLLLAETRVLSANGTIVLPIDWIRDVDMGSIALITSIRARSTTHPMESWDRAIGGWGVIGGDYQLMLGLEVLMLIQIVRR